MSDAAVPPGSPVRAPLDTVPVRRADGTGFELTVARADDPGAPTVLVVPAMGMQARWYRHVLTALQSDGITAAVTELRGHDAGPRAGRRHDWGYGDLVDDLGLAVDALRGIGSPRPVLLGHSLGGHLAAVYAGSAPDRLRGLVLLASGSVHWRLWSTRHLVRTQAAGVAARVLGHFPGDRVGFAGREARTQTRDWARFARTGRLTFGRPRRDHGAAMAGVRLPVLVISLDGDRLSPPASVDGLAALLPNARITRRHVTAPADDRSSVDHLRWARDPDRVLSPVRDWLRTLDKRG